MMSRPTTRPLASLVSLVSLACGVAGCASGAEDRSNAEGAAREDDKPLVTDSFRPEIPSPHPPPPPTGPLPPPAFYRTGDPVTCVAHLPAILGILDPTICVNALIADYAVLVWNAPSTPVDGYRLYRYDGATRAEVLLATENADFTTYAVPRPAEGTTQCYFVSSVKAGAESTRREYCVASDFPKALHYGQLAIGPHAFGHTFVNEGQGGGSAVLDTVAPLVAEWRGSLASDVFGVGWFYGSGCQGKCESGWGFSRVAYRFDVASLSSTYINEALLVVENHQPTTVSGTSWSFDPSALNSCVPTVYLPNSGDWETKLDDTIPDGDDVGKLAPYAPEDPSAGLFANVSYMNLTDAANTWRTGDNFGVALRQDTEPTSDIGGPNRGCTGFLVVDLRVTYFVAD